MPKQLFKTKKEDSLGTVSAPAEAQIILEWEAPERIFVRRTNAHLRQVAALSLVGSLIFIFFKQWAFILAIWAFYFFYYVMGVVPPKNIRFRITGSGVEAYGKLYLWEELKNFWFSEKGGQSVLNLLTVAFPPRLIIPLGGQKAKEVEKVLGDHLKEEAPPAGTGFIDEWWEKLAKKVNLD